MRRLAATVMACAALVVGCSSGPELTPDEAYLAGLDERSMLRAPGFDDSLITAGRAFCDAGRDGLPIATIVMLSGSVFSERDTRAMAASAVEAYCPDVEIAGL